LSQLIDGIHNYLHDYKSGKVLEIGAGNTSSRLLARVASTLNTSLVSVDPNPRAHKKSADIENVHTTGEEFLAQTDDQFFLVYMDGYDWANHWEYPQVAAYKGCTKEESEKSHLEQIKLLLPRLTSPSFVLFDDTGIEDPNPLTPEQIMERVSEIQFYGKGATAIPLMIQNGFSVIGYSPNSSHGGPQNQKDQVLLEKK